MPATRFSKVQIPRASGNRLSGDVITKLAGLDMVTPIEVMAPGRTPEAHDFRLYEQTEAGREVAVTTRKGPSLYTTPLGETLNTSNTSSVGASSVNVGTQSFIQLQPFTADASGLLTRIDLQTAVGTATSAMRVDIYSDSNGLPSKLLTRSSISDMGTDFAWNEVRFINSINIVSGMQYWIVVYMQDDGVGFGALRTTTSGVPASEATGSILGATPQAYSILHRVYTSPANRPLGAYRFNRDDGVNRTIAAYGTTMYVVDETNKILTKLVDGLSANASNYSFTDGDGKVFWVNGYDDLMAWNGVTESEADNMQPNGTFETSTSGWLATGGGSGVALTRVTTDKNSGVASMNVTATSGVRVARTTVALKKNHRYKFTYYVKGTGGSVYMYAYGPNVTIPGSTTALNGSWQKVEFYYTPSVSTITDVGINSDTVNFLLDDVTFVDTGIEYIIDTELPILKDICFHKDRMFGVSMADKNKMVFSENPGNPSDAAADAQWYYAWLSVSFIYVPRPKNGSPITAIVPFQDNLVIFTQDKKYILSGSDRGNYFLRESTGSEGALSRRGVISDPNFIYFVGHDGIYRFNGAKDEKVSSLIQPLYDKCPLKHEITLALWKSDLRVYLASEFSATHDITAILSGDFGEWMLDTNTWTSRALYYDDVDDQMELIEFSSLTATLYNAEQDFNSLGAPIDFDYRLKYDSRGIPGQRKKFKKYVPLVQAVGKSFPITYGSDKDFEDAPREKQQQLNVGGSKIGEFFIGDGTILTGSTAFKPKKTSISGYSRYMQFRVSREAVNNQVAFMGVQFTYKAKKL